MGERNAYPHGTFCWSELVSTDHEGAKAFYGSLFGWSAEDAPVGEGMSYTMFQLQGKDVAAGYAMGEEQKATGHPPYWGSYISVDDVDTIAKRVPELGGTLLSEPFEVMDTGRMAMVRDPAEAIVGLWQPKSHIGARIVNEPGTLCWNELMVTDTSVAEKFWTELLGWTAETMTDGSVPYTMFHNGDRVVAGMYEMDPGMGAPPSWLVYFAVTDCDESAAKLEKLGGTVLRPPFDIPVGRMAIVQDAQGAAFALLKLTQPQD